MCRALGEARDRDLVDHGAQEPRKPLSLPPIHFQPVIQTNILHHTAHKGSSTPAQLDNSMVGLLVEECGLLQLSLIHISEPTRPY